MLGWFCGGFGVFVGRVGLGWFVVVLGWFWGGSGMVLGWFWVVLRCSGWFWLVLSWF